MSEDIRRAEYLVEAARRRFVQAGLPPAETALDPYAHGCMVHLDFAGDAEAGLTFTVTHRSDRIEVLDGADYSMSESELLEYLVMRARGTPPDQAFTARLLRA
ncbi:hypothetical protein Lfu02_49270 [Longispora fulva]|uniref:CubicO group peptidase (Beta-lactamase class C family) n=1 Tax=Longispora fulva TaxID=619741 RepID=A0A8J7KKM3_9ACTN|nr:hypothetical protein [Longispora fulva]MBG6138304.1 CubicO group peptidase (beta-lactamase class C family) [Longispora fulva]GIG60555.1 hypothetical protein Lfu02_49270 [Longispora fulva]